MADKPAASFKTLITTDAAPTSTTEAHAIMTVLGGLETGRVLLLKREPMKVGRAPDCTFVFDDAGISGHHCKILYMGGVYAVLDDGSTNGTFVNGLRLEQATPLRDGDRIQLGQSTQLKFSLVRADERDALVRVYEAAFRDALSGAFNRKHLEERLDSELAFALRHGTELSLIMLDLDHFKKVNDTHGHLAGDLVIKTFADLLMRVVRTEDIVARYGGEEFVILTRGVPLAGAGALAERARQTLEGTVIPFSGNDLRVTCSSGVASLRCCGEQRDRATLLGLADGRLYKGKAAGRNRVATA
jgi:diguanylate cyclase (GGDEF)-like protein